MHKRVGKHLQGNVVAYVALFVALGGSAYAVTALDRNSVKSKHIVNGQVKSADVKNDGLTGGDVNEARLGEVPKAAEADRLDGKDSTEFLGASEQAADAETLDNSLGDVMWAVVNSSGTLVRSSPGVSAVLPCGTGCVHFAFPRSITNCAWVASPSSPDSGDPSGGFVTARIDSGNSGPDPTALRVFTASSNGTAANLSFHVIVTCPPA